MPSELSAGFRDFSGYVFSSQCCALFTSPLYFTLLLVLCVILIYALTESKFRGILYASATAFALVLLHDSLKKSEFELDKSKKQQLDLINQVTNADRVADALKEKIELPIHPIEAESEVPMAPTERFSA